MCSKRSSSGQAVAGLLLRCYLANLNPGGLSASKRITRHVGQIPVYYNFKLSAHLARYVDAESMPYYPFGHGLSYSTFETSEFQASIRGVRGGGAARYNAPNFTSGDTIDFSAKVANTGSYAGSYGVQVYLLGRVSTIVQPVKQLVAFSEECI